MKIIDIHTHGIYGFDTATTSEDHILSIAQIHGSHDVTDIIPTVYSSAIETMRENMLAIRSAMEEQLKEAESGASRIIGIHLEGPFLNPTKCGAMAARSFLQPNEYNLKKLIDGFEDIVKIITIAPEMDGAVKLIRRIADMGIIVGMGHSDATYAEAEEGFNAGASGIVHIFNAMRGFHHREPGIAGFGLMNKDIYIEVIADPFHLHEEITRLIFKIKNPERIIIISDTEKNAKTEPHPHGIRNRENRLLGGSMTIQESSERLIQLGLDKDIIMKAISENPERYLQAN